MNLQDFLQKYKGRTIATLRYPTIKSFFIIPSLLEMATDTHFWCSIINDDDSHENSFFAYEPEDWIVIKELDVEDPTIAKNATVQKALRFNSNKLRLAENLPYNALCALATVVERNSDANGGKYPDQNYRKGAPHSEYMNCLLRHFMQHMSGELIDPTDGVPHLYKIAWNACMAIETDVQRPELNDLDLKFKLDFNDYVNIIKKERKGE